MQARITIFAFVLLSAGGANAPAGTLVEGAIPPKEGAVSPLRPDAVQEAERELKLDATARRTALHIALPPASRTERATQAPGRGPVAVAFHREMPEQFLGDLSSRLEWTPLGDVALAAAMSVTSPGATDMRMGVLVDLPPGGELRFFGTDAGRRFPVVTRADLAWKRGEPQTLWSPVVEGDTIGVEITLPSRAALSTFSFRVDRVSHGYAAERAPESGYVPEALECPGYHRDYRCGVGRHFPESRGNSAARLRYEKSGTGYVCSGTLLNDRDDSTFIPYLLTANHCISTARVASSVSARWFYRRSACGSSSGLDSRATTTSGGAALLATSAVQDATLLRLEGNMPGGLLYSGWDPNRITHPRDVYLVHHPDGGVKKYSAGTTTRHVDLTDGTKDAIQTDWSEGTTEGGSSGGGLFAGEYLVGVHAGSSISPDSCALRHGFAGAFSDFYPQIRRWLEASAPPPPPPPPGGGGGGGPVLSSDASLSALSLSAGALAFAPETTTYPVAVPYAVAGVTVTPTASDSGATVTVNGGEVSSGEASAAIALPVGETRIEVVVTAQNGTTTRTYTVTVTRAPAEVAFLPSASSALHGFVRVVNEGDEAGTVRIRAFDDEGEEYGPVTLALGAGAAVQLSAHDLESGNPDRGLTGSTGPGQGRWRLVFESELAFRALGYVRIRGASGFPAAMHDVVAESRPSSKGYRYEVASFNPASNPRQASVLRLANRSGAQAAVRITGTDDAGRAGEDAVTLTLPARAARTLSAPALESGEGEGLDGALGDGTGKWRLRVGADRPLSVLSLMRSLDGHLTNLSTAPRDVERLWLLPSAANAVRYGFVRVVNEGDEAGTVRIRAFDDEGEEYGPVTLALGAGAAVQFSAHDLESGNPDRGLTGSTGPGQGRWRLVFESELAFRALGYVRTRGASGFPAAMHDVVAESPSSKGYRYEVASFNPASNPRQASVLLLVNRSDAAASVTITGTDDAGREGDAAVTLRLRAEASRRLWAPALESGEGEGLDGALGDGTGKWRLSVASDRPLAVMSLMRSLEGHLTNLSTAPPASR